MNAQLVNRIKYFRGPQAGVIVLLRASDNFGYLSYVRICSGLARPNVNLALLLLQAAFHLFEVLHLPSAPLLPSIPIESWPAGLVMAVTDF
jgi:hypothetical protein